MPPQGAVLAGALAGTLSWNYRRSLAGKVTISMFLAEHKVIAAAGWLALNAWLIPHIALKETTP
jgi:hypothetical protein